MALKSKPLMICNFFFGYLLIRYYRSIMLNIYEIRDVRVGILEILFTFLYSNSYIYIYIYTYYAQPNMYTTALIGGQDVWRELEVV